MTSQDSAYPNNEANRRAPDRPSSGGVGTSRATPWVVPGSPSGRSWHGTARCERRRLGDGGTVVETDVTTEPETKSMEAINLTDGHRHSNDPRTADSGLSVPSTRTDRTLPTHPT